MLTTLNYFKKSFERGILNNNYYSVLLQKGGVGRQIYNWMFFYKPSLVSLEECCS